MATYEMTDDDYYDSEQELFVINLSGNVIIYTDLVIYDDNTPWDCYLVSARYNKETNTYTMFYSAY